MPEKHNAAKEYLRQVKLLDVHINDRLEELERLEAMATKITSSLSPDPGGGSGYKDKLGDAVSKIADMQKEINDAVDCLVNKKKEIRELLKQVRDPVLLDILYKVYFQFETLEKVAFELGYSYKQTTRLHGKALFVVNKLLEEKDVHKCP